MMCYAKYGITKPQQTFILRNMKLFYERYAQLGKKLLRAVAVLRWGHNLLLLTLGFLGLTGPIAEKGAMLLANALS